MIRAIQIVTSQSDCDEVTSAMLMGNNDVVVTYFNYNGEKKEVRIKG